MDENNTVNNNLEFQNAMNDSTIIRFSDSYFDN